MGAIYWERTYPRCGCNWLEPYFLLTHFNTVYVEDKPCLANTSPAADSGLTPQAVAEFVDKPASADGKVAEAASPKPQAASAATAVDEEFSQPGSAEASDARPDDVQDTAEKQARPEGGEAPSRSDCFGAMTRLVQRPGSLGPRPPPGLTMGKDRISGAEGRDSGNAGRFAQTPSWLGQGRQCTTSVALHTAAALLAPAMS